MGTAPGAGGGAGREGSRVVDADVSGNGADEADQLLVRRHSHSAVPLGEPARRTQSPGGTGEVQPPADAWRFKIQGANQNRELTI